MELWMLGGDARSMWAARTLRKNGYTVRCFGVPEEKTSPLPEAMECAILPFPSLSGKHLRGEAAIETGEILPRVKKAVFGGLLEPVRTEIEARGAECCDLYGAEPMTTANAVATAEGAIALAIQHSPAVLYNSNCLVTGFGRVGKVLAQRLHALGASVTIAARRPAELALAEAMGLESDAIGSYRHGLSRYDFIFNTVPARVFSRLPEGKNCVYIELASKPFGIAPEEAGGVIYLPAPGLPGKTAPKTAGALYAQAIMERLY